MTLDELSNRSDQGRLIIHSLPNGLYQAYFEGDGHSEPLTQDSGPVRAFSIGKLYELLGGFPFRAVLLRQLSPYDEMIGQPLRDSNELLVPVNWRDNCW